MFSKESYLESVLKKLVIDESEITRANNWISIIKEEFEQSEKGKFGEPPFKTGSYKRQTAIKPLHDVDIFLVLDRSHYERNDISDLIEIFRRKTQSILDRRKKDLIGKSQTTLYPLAMNYGVVIKWPRKDPFLQMDIIPAFPHSKREKYYIIPDIRRNQWIETSKIDHLDNLKDANIRLQGMVTKFVKLLKHWNVINKKPTSSFHLEVMIVDISKNLPNNLEEGTKKIFELLSQKVKEKLTHPSGVGPSVSELDVHRSEKLKNKLEEDLRKLNDNKWQEVF